MSQLLQFLSYDFAQRAVAAGVLVALLGAVVGFFVVLRRMAFVAVGISHAALGGVALGVLLGQSPVLWAIGFGIAVALAMSVLARRGVAEDTAMGIFFPAAMAFGVVVISFTQSWQRDLFSYLFGSLLGVQPADLLALAVTAAAALLLVGLFFKELLYISFDEESAHAAGVPVAPLRALLLVVTAATVVVSIKVVGVVLVSAMLVIPAACAAQLTSRWQAMLGLAAMVGVVALLTGLGVSFAAPHDIPPGPAAVLVAAGMFVLSAGCGGWLRSREERRAQAVPAAAVAPDILPPVEAAVTRTGADTP